MSVGKKPVTNDELEYRIKILEKKIEALKISETGGALGGKSGEQAVIQDIQVDGGGHVTSTSGKLITYRDGLIISIG